MVTPILDKLTARATLLGAFERVRENAGCRGADGVTIEQFARDLARQIDHLQDRLLGGSYHPFPLLSIDIPKREHGPRRLAVPTVRDRVVQTAVYQLTRDRFDAELAECSYAFRPGRSVKSAIHRIDELRRQGYRWIVEADIEDFFDSIPHERLLRRIHALQLEPYVESLFGLWIKAEIYDGRGVGAVSRGIAQGSVVSPMLANLYLDELDESLALFGQTVVRYSDDLLVLCKSERQAAEALELTDYLVAELELALNREKTRAASFDQGFKFLGAVFLRDAIYLPFDRPRPVDGMPSLPSPLDLLSYLELRGGARQ